MKFKVTSAEDEERIQKEMMAIRQTVPWVIKNEKNEYMLDVNMLSSYIKNNSHFLFARNQATDKTMVYLYIDGVYKHVSDNEIMAAIKQFIPQSLMSSSAVKEIFFDITTQNKFTRVDALDDYENLINFKDGLYNIKEDELIEHSPRIYSTIQIPAYYNEIKNAPDEAPVFDQYIGTLCGKKDENGEIIRDPDKEFFLLQYIGLSISNYYGYRTKKALFLEGKGDSGKSQIKSLVEYLLGGENYSTASLQEISERFGTAAVYQKRLVGCNDMSDETVRDISILKQLTGGDSIQIEFKHSNKFDYTYRGVLWFNCNKMPLFYGDKGKWVYDRVINIKCDNSIPKSKQDKEILNKMKKEKNTIIKRALIALKELVNNNFNFIDLPEIRANRENFEIKNSTLLSFIDECCVVDTDGSLSRIRTPRKDFKDAYAAYVVSNYKGKGLVKWVDCIAMLKEKFNCDVIKSNGIMCLTNIKLNPAYVNEYINCNCQIGNVVDLVEEQKKKKEEDNKKKIEMQKNHTVNVVNEYKKENYTVDDMYMKVGE